MNTLGYGRRPGGKVRHYINPHGRAICGVTNCKPLTAKDNADLAARRITVCANCERITDDFMHGMPEDAPDGYEAIIDAVEHTSPGVAVITATIHGWNGGAALDINRGADVLVTPKG